MPDPDRPTVHVTSPTEGRNPRTVDIDQLPIMDVLRRINNEDALDAAAVAEALPAVAAVVELAVASLTVGGRVHYVGAGTSGRIAMLDAVEISQTYGVPKDWFLAHHAGGLPALGELLEDVEDDETAGAMDTADVQRGDVVVGLSASGRSPYVLGALLQPDGGSAPDERQIAGPGPRRPDGRGRRGRADLRARPRRGGW
jgi:N-acetylmuramic acid 6-phosphate etherase